MITFIAGMITGMLLFVLIYTALGAVLDRISGSNTNEHNGCNVEDNIYYTGRLCPKCGALETRLPELHANILHKQGCDGAVPLIRHSSFVYQRPDTQ